MTKEERKKFRKVFMDNLFSNLTKEEQCFENRNLSNIPKQSGIYVIKYDGTLTENDILNEPQKPKYYEDKYGVHSMVNDEELNKEALCRKYEVQNDNEYLYVGKANNLQHRIELYIKFCNENGKTVENPAKTPHRGGKAICFIADRSKLKRNYVSSIEIANNSNGEIKLFYDNAIQIQKKTPALFKTRKGRTISLSKNQIECVLETGLTELNIEVYGKLPFANSENDKSLSEHRQLWQQYWQQRFIDLGI